MLARLPLAPAIITAVVVMSHLFAADVFELPAPTGTYAVGTTTWRVRDDTRAETFGNPGDRRQMQVLAWYPAAPRSAAGSPAPYLREGVAEVRVFARLLGAPEATFDDLATVRTHADFDAEPAAAPAKFPVIVFSHGYTGIPSAHTALVEDLASHGYVVLSVVHPYEATAATLADGRVVTMLDAAGGLRSPIADVFKEWASEDDQMAAVTRATDEAEQRRLLRGYLDGLHNTGLALRRWVDDTRLVIDRLSAVPRASAAGRVAARLDLARLGVAGHSMGGVTAAQFCVEDRRCKAALNLDGIPQYGPMIDKTMAAPFMMVYSARPGRAGASDAIYHYAASRYIRADVADTRHLDFSDMAFWGGPLRERPILGPIAPLRATELTRALVRQFFDQELLGRRSALLAGTGQLNGATVRTFAPLVLR